LIYDPTLLTIAGSGSADAVVAGDRRGIDTVSYTIKILMPTTAYSQLV